MSELVCNTFFPLPSEVVVSFDLAVVGCVRHSVSSVEMLAYGIVNTV